MKIDAQYGSHQNASRTVVNLPKRRKREARSRRTAERSETAAGRARSELPLPQRLRPRPRLRVDFLLYRESRTWPFCAFRPAARRRNAHGQARRLALLGQQSTASRLGWLRTTSRVRPAVSAGRKRFGPQGRTAQDDRGREAPRPYSRLLPPSRPGAQREEPHAIRNCHLKRPVRQLKRSARREDDTTARGHPRCRAVENSNQDMRQNAARDKAGYLQKHHPCASSFQKNESHT